MDRDFESDLREEGILSWDAEAMLHAISIAQRSKDKRSFSRNTKRNTII